MTEAKKGKDSSTTAKEKARGTGRKARGGKGQGRAIEELKESIETLQNEKKELNDRMLRLHAETENFKKRIIKEKEDFQKYSNESAIREFLPVIDNLERAVTHAKEAGESGALLEGVEMTLTLFNQTLEGLGVSTVSAVGEPFDPEKHEAVQQIESEEHEPNIIVSEFQKGYMLCERLIRPAMVIVSRPPMKKEENK